MAGSPRKAGSSKQAGGGTGRETRLGRNRTSRTGQQGQGEKGENVDLKGLDIESYVVTDGFFGGPWVDRDEWRTNPVPHRNVHGGFEGTDTRFTFYFPAAEGYLVR